MRVLIVEDDHDTGNHVRSVLERRGALALTAGNAPEALDLLSREAIDVVVTDLELGADTGPTFGARLVQTVRQVPVILLTGTETVDTAISVLRAGAYDLLTKPVDAELLWASVQRADQHQRLQREVQRLRHAIADHGAQQVPFSRPLIVRDSHGSHPASAFQPPIDLVPLAEIEQRHILGVLDAVGGNKALAARVLQLDRTTLYRKLERYGAAQRQRHAPGEPVAKR